MESRAKFLGHPIHQMLIPFPLGLLGMSLFFDLIGLFWDIEGLLIASYYMIAGGIIAGLVAAVFGLIDFLGIPSGTRAHRVGLVHGLGNVVVVGLFAVSWFLRRGNHADPADLAIWISAVGVGIAMVTGWLGGELVDRLGVGVDPGAHVDAPSSLSGRPASEVSSAARP